MSSPVILRRAALLLPVLLFAGPVACDPAVSKHELNMAQSRVDEATQERARAQQEVEALLSEQKALTSFGGPEHQQKLQVAMSLRKEKTELESLQKDLTARLEHFAAEAKRHREALAKAKQP